MPSFVSFSIPRFDPSLSLPTFLIFFSLISSFPRLLQLDQGRAVASTSFLSEVSKWILPSESKLMVELLKFIDLSPYNSSIQ